MVLLLDSSDSPAGLNLPGYRLHQLKGDRKGQWAAWVSANWRLVFEFDGDDAVNKAGWSTAATWLGAQAAYDLWQVRQRADSIKVARYPAPAAA